MAMPALLPLVRFAILATVLALVSACNPTPVPGGGYGVNEGRPEAIKG
jgi:hypothetical protein